MEVVDSKPKKPQHDTPIVVALGWLETAKAYRPLVHKLNSHGYRVIIPNIDATQPLLPGIKANYPAIELHHASALIAALDEAKVERADILAHSEGALAALIAADLYPARFSRVLLINPACIVRTSVWQLTKGFWKEAFVVLGLVAKELFSIGGEKKLLSHTALAGQMCRVFFSQPLLSLQSVRAMAKSDTTWLIPHVRARGVKVGVVLAQWDHLFPLAQTRAALKKIDIDVLHVMHDHHLSFLFDAHGYGALIDRMLQNMQ